MLFWRPKGHEHHRQSHPHGGAENLPSRLFRATEAKFGIKGVSHIIKGRFLAEIPPLGGLSMREDIEYEAIARFFKDQALSLISEDLAQGA